MAEKPQFTAVPVVAMAAISTANTNRDGTGTLVDVVTGATNGTRIDRITVQATGTTTAGMVRLFINDGTNSRLYSEFAVTAATPSATVKAFASQVSDLALSLPNGHKLQASTHNAESFNVIAEGGTF